jgi:radical SAM protein with 4Fe4S-binding SPASM domain
VERLRVSFCPVGTDALIVSPEGRASACYLMPEDWTARGLDMDVGHVFADGRVAIDQSRLEQTRLLPMAKSRCEGCLAQWTCAGGCHVNQTYPGCDQAFTDFCIQTRLISTCLLLRDLDSEALVDELLSDRRAMERLALRDADPIAVGDWDADAIRKPGTSATLSRPRSLVSDAVSLLG